MEILYVFGRGGEEAEELYEAGIPFEVIPGISSAIAAPAYAGIPVTHRDHASSVTFITGHENPTKEESSIDWNNLAQNPGTLVFLMGVKNLKNISDSLISCGKSPNIPAALIQWGTTTEQKSLISTLSKIPEDAQKKGIKAPAVLVVGSVALLQEKLGWFERKPLFGKRVLVTRGREQSRKMAEQIIEQGGDPILFPTIQITSPSDLGPLDAVFERVNTYDWILFTSVNGVERFFKRFFELHGDIRKLCGPKIGAIGPITAAALKKYYLNVDLLAKEYLAEGVLELLNQRGIKGQKFLIPRAEKARELLPEEIVKHGGIVDVITVYKTVIPSDSDIQKIRELFTRREVDVVTFTSSSTVTHFCEMLDVHDLADILQNVTVASIGPITSKTLSEKGLKIDIEASEYTIDGLISAIADYFAKRG